MKFEEWYKTVDGHLSPHPRTIALAGWNAAVEQAALIANDKIELYKTDANDLRRAQVCSDIREAIRHNLK